MLDGLRRGDSDNVADYLGFAQGRSGADFYTNGSNPCEKDEIGVKRSLSRCWIWLIICQVLLALVGRPLNDVLSWLISLCENRPWLGRNILHRIIALASQREG